MVNFIAKVKNVSLWPKTHGLYRTGVSFCTRNSLKGTTKHHSAALEMLYLVNARVQGVKFHFYPRHTHMCVEPVTLNTSI